MKLAQSLAIVFAVAALATPVLKAAEKPNVLFIAIDDLRPELGCYGEAAIRSPNIDTLAASGVVFERAYCQFAVCNPSRVSIMTGLRPDSTKVWDLATRFRHTIPDTVTLPQQFMKHGYHAVSFGKIFHNPWPDNESWSEPHAWPEKRSLWSDAAKQRHAEYREKMRADGRSESQVKRMRAQATEIVETPDHEHIDGAIAEQALAAMKRLAERDEPFFLAAGFVRPHLPFVVPRKYWELYDADAIPVSPNPFLPKNAPTFSMNTMYELRDYFDFDGTPLPNQAALTESQQRRLKHGYYASVSFIDSLVGRLLTELETLGLADNTIVVLWGDHGWKLGEHNSWCKQTNYEIDARVPLIIRAPNTTANGHKTNALVELVDVYPTLCELAGLPALEHLEGRSVVPLLSNPKQPWKQAAFSQFRRQDGRVPLMGYAMRTDRYRYIEWQDRRTRDVVATELYDHENDPHENSNIAGAAENKMRLGELSRQMWAALPRPPEYVPPKRPRPQITFENHGDVPLTVYWITPDGEEQKSGVIQPGAQMQRNTTLGHRFRLRGPEKFNKIYEVTKRRQSFEIEAKQSTPVAGAERRPNIVFCMADDWSWPHAGILGDPVVKTPNFDQIARHGVLFENAFVSTPSCTPSRLSILTGQHHWRLQEGDSLGGSLREEFDVYTEMLQKAGYRIGRFGKGVWPSKHTFRERDSFGERFRSFDEFINEREPDEPFCYWHGGQDPHRPYELGVGVASGIKLSEVKVPACLPDNATVRGDVADYLWEVQRFDREVGEIVARLKAIGELDNTIIVVSGDNGMPFPRCKATLYDQGTRVPLAVQWGAKVEAGRRVSDFVSLCDLAPTFLHAAGVKPSARMTGRSLMPILESEDSGQIDAARTFVLTGMEKHVYSYPARALRTKEFLFIQNFGSAEWATGEIDGHNPKYDFGETSWPTEPGAFSFNIDPSPSKQLLRLFRDAKDTKPFADLSFQPHPDEELYDLRADPDQLRNVAGDMEYAKTQLQLKRRLTRELIKSGDPRLAAGDASTQPIASSDYRVTPPPAELELPPFYTKYVNANGYPIVSSGSVNDYALKEAAYLVDMMLSKRPDIRQAMIDSDSRLIVMAHNEFTTDIPEYSKMRPKDYWDARARGLGGSRDEPVCSCAEENVLAFEGDPYSTENILIHEFAHNIHLRGLVNMDAAFDNRLKKTFDHAMSQGLWKSKYASTNHAEYFAEGVQSWFNNNRPPDHDHNHVDTRKELQEYDPGLAAICKEVFGDTELVYTKPATRLKGHLAGYQPEESPTFQWPERLEAAKKRIREQVKKRGDKRKQEYKN